MIESNMLYFFDCPACDTELSVPALEVQKRTSTFCQKCGSEVRLADVELKEGRILVVIRCPHADCTHREEEQWVPLTRSFLKQAVSSGGDDRLYCQYCGRTFKMNNVEKKNTAKMLEEEAAQKTA
jgi:transposase-like protein